MGQLGNVPEAPALPPHGTHPEQVTPWPWTPCLHAVEGRLYFGLECLGCLQVGRDMVGVTEELMVNIRALRVGVFGVPSVCS
jgi:hypothetical protein